MIREISDIIPRLFKCDSSISVRVSRGLATPSEILIATKARLAYVFLDFFRKITLPRNWATFEIFVMQVLKLVFWILILTPVIAAPLLFLLTTIFGIPVHLG